MPIEDHPLRLARIRAGVGQRELAQAIGLNRSSVAAIEEARTAAPSADTLQKLESQLRLAPGSLGRDLDVWATARAKKGVILSPRARAVLALSPADVQKYSSFVAWRSEIVPSATAFASLLGVNRAVVAKYEQGIRARGMPDTLAHALVTTLHISNDYLLALARLEPAEDEL